MTDLNAADAIYLGAAGPATRVYLGTNLVHGTAPVTGPTIIAQTAASGVTTDIAVPLPSGSGGLLLLSISTSGGVQLNGWTQLRYDRIINRSLGVFYRQADGTEPDPIVSQYGSTDAGWEAQCYRISGANATSPIDNSSYNIVTTAVATPTASLTAPTLSTDVDNALLFAICTVDSYSGDPTFSATAPTGYGTAVYEPGPGSPSSGNLIVSNVAQPTAGATGAVTTTVGLSTNGIGYEAILVAIKS